jgi:signal transduction histidine kinase
MNSAVQWHPTPAPASPSNDLRETVPELLVELAHDLRSPLTSIMSLADHLQRGGAGPVTASQRRQLAIIYSAALCLSQTASGVVDLGRGDRGSEYDRPGPFSLTELFGATETIVAPMVEEKGLELRTLVRVQDWRVGSLGTLGRVLLNLVTNALKFTEEGLVELTADPAGPGVVELSIRDTGPGLDPYLIRSLFQPFPVTDPPAPRRYFSSSGLGLALCRELVASMGSELKVESRPHSGTRFYFLLELPEIAQSARFRHPPPYPTKRTA